MKQGPDEVVMDRHNRLAGHYREMVARKQIFFLTGRRLDRQRWRSGCVRLLAGLCGVVTIPAWAMEAGEILRAVDQAMAAPAQEMALRIVNRLVEQEESPVVMIMAKKGGDRLMAMVVAPEPLKGMTIVRNGAEVWSRAPGKDVEARAEGLAKSFFGAGVFNNEDILHLDFQQEYQPALAREDPTNWYLELTPKAGWVPYARLSLVVDKEFKLPRSVTQYGPGNVLIKTIQYAQMQRFGDGPMRPSLLESANPLNPGYVSTLRYGDVQVRAAPEALFSRAALTKIGGYFLREK
ncbi:MAG: outer membrane lipoprotein-sorting protein [Magnetococcales bacterium]|nr:outer membrane lipoprotein-sorting protein [Magnetococcales bacterium]